MFLEPLLAVLANLFIHTNDLNTLFPGFHVEKREIQQHFSSMLQLYIYIRACLRGLASQSANEYCLNENTIPSIGERHGLKASGAECDSVLGLLQRCLADRFSGNKGIESDSTLRYQKPVRICLLRNPANTEQHGIPVFTCRVV